MKLTYDGNQMARFAFFKIWPKYIALLDDYAKYLLKFVRLQFQKCGIIITQGIFWTTTAQFELCE